MKYKPLDDNVAEYITLIPNAKVKHDYPTKRPYTHYDIQTIWWGMCFYKNMIKELKKEVKNV